ncbi:MAG: hypothetical protein FD180_420 [Planctomycetota bacterium]|nr:MAG: hypothetical protein FD180_420 [Planctomycetota bacterium]
MELRYAPEMLEEAVAREILRRETAGDAAWSRDFHVVTDPFYAMQETERNARFRDANAVFFRQLGLAQSLEAAVAGLPALGPAVEELVLDRCATATDEGADLCVTQGSKPHVRILFRVHRLDDPAALEGFFRHELKHVEDMLRPAFEYRALGRIAERPAEENLVRARLRLLWNLVAAGEIARAGVRGAATREEWATMVTRNYPGFPAETRGRILARLWDSPEITWPLLIELSLHPKKLLRYCGIHEAESPRGPGSLCPLCSFPTFEWHEDAATLPVSALAQVRADFPRWDPADGACRQCLDSYVFRARFAPTVAARPTTQVQEGSHVH